MSETVPQIQKDLAINSALKDIKDIGANPAKYYVTFSQ
jgi:hypothetical protein